MKNILITAIILLTISCKAQIVSLDSKRYNSPTNTYFKDISNEMDKFTGTWEYINGTDTLTIIIEKAQMAYDGDEFYEDLLVGEYKYVQNGIEKVNTLSNLDNTSIEGRYHNISGRHIIPNQTLYVNCDDCTNTERRFRLNFNDPERKYLSVSIVLRYLLNQTNPEKMTATITSKGGVMIPNENSPTQSRVPHDEYLMEKQ